MFMVLTPLMRGYTMTQRESQGENGLVELIPVVIDEAVS